MVIKPEQLDGEASVVLDELMRQAVEAVGVGTGSTQDVVEMEVMQWGPVPVAAELEIPEGADIKSVASKRGGNLFSTVGGGVFRAVGAVGGGILAERQRGSRGLPCRACGGKPLTLNLKP
jgi:hypothetical protein